MSAPKNQESVKNTIEEASKILAATYKPQSVIMDHGKGVYAWDTEGRKYLDCAAGIAVASLGHAHPEMMKTITEQAQKMMAVQASYVTQPKYEAAKLLVDNGCFDIVYFANSGTESVEAALKTARKWAYEEKGEHCNEIITFRKSFHGRTMGSASITEKRLSQPFYAPYLEGIHYADFNDIDSVAALISDKTAAIIVEPVQGEGGLTPANPSFLRGLRNLCDENNICLIFDEVQAGMGRMGTFYAYQSFKCCPDCQGGGAPNPDNHEAIEPDIVCLAKGIGGGFPVGAMVAKEKFGRALTPGSHGTTYGGNPLATAVTATVLKEILKPGFLEHVQDMSEFFVEGLEDIQRRSNKITGIRGRGLMLGFTVAYEATPFASALRKNGMMCTIAGGDAIRLTPPLIINKDEAQEALDIIEKTLKEGV